MLLAFCRYVALIFAFALVIAETVLNTVAGSWHYAPLWVIDYVVAAYLLAGFWMSRRERGVPVLMSAYALAVGMLYMAVFANYDPDLPAELRGPGELMALMWLALAVSAVGLVGTTLAWVRRPTS